MLISADGAAATLSLLIPGFVALSVFYWFGLAVKRTDWRWLLWSLLATVPLTFVARWISAGVIGAFGLKSGDVGSAAATCAGKQISTTDSISEIESAVKTCVASASDERYLSLDVWVAIILGVAAGLAAAWAWRRLSRVFPALRRRTEPLAWGSVLRTPQWVQAETEKVTYIGWVREMSDPVETDAGDLDIYLTHPRVVTGPGETKPLDVEGVLLARDAIKSLLILRAVTKTAS